MSVISLKQSGLSGLGRSRSIFGATGFLGFDPDALAYIQAVETADGEPLEAGVKVAIDDFVRGCKADGIWSSLKASCIMAGARTLNGALVPLVGAAPTNFNFVSGDYDRKTGLKGDGATKYLDSNRANNADPQNSVHRAVWITEAMDPVNGGILSSGGATFVGADNIGRLGAGSGNDLLFYSRHDGGVTAGDLAVVENARTTLGLWMLFREDEEVFGGRIAGTEVTQTNTSNTPNANNLFVFARPDELSNAVSITNPRISFYSIGEALDRPALDTRVSDLMTAIDGAIA
jgi:hypothetical protein